MQRVAAVVVVRCLVGFFFKSRPIRSDLKIAKKYLHYTLQNIAHTSMAGHSSASTIAARELSSTNGIFQVQFNGLIQIPQNNCATVVVRPPFINGRPQDLVSVFLEKKVIYPCFLGIFPLFFIFFYLFFPITSFVKGVTRDHQGTMEI